jgi:hypothetical protein
MWCFKKYKTTRSVVEMEEAIKRNTYHTERKKLYLLLRETQSNSLAKISV